MLFAQLLYVFKESALKMDRDELENEERKGESKWKKSDSLKKKTRYYYRSVDDVIEKGKRPGAYRNLGSAR